MAGPDMSHAAHGPAAGGVVADYLAAVAAQLRGPAAARAQITDELREGLAARHCLATRATLT